VLALITLLTVGSAVALRNYWLRQSLNKSAAELVTEMRGMQQRAMAESHPVVYGIRVTAGSVQSSRTWSIVRFDPRKSTGKCKALEEHEFPGGVRVSAASFTSAGTATDECRAIYGASSQFALFFARGTATAGELTLTSPSVDGARQVEVAGVTGRVEAQ